MKFASKEKLVQEISVYGRRSAEARQVYSRLYKLLPERLSEIKRNYKGEFSASKASRLALCDKKYKEHIREYLDIKEESQRDRIQWETHRMYFYARKLFKF